MIFKDFKELISVYEGTGLTLKGMAKKDNKKYFKKSDFTKIMSFTTKK